MSIRRPAVVLGHGRRLSLGIPESGLLPTDDQLAAVRSGAVPVTIEAFVEFDGGDGYHRWALAWGFAVVWPSENHTTTLLRAAEQDIGGNDHPLAALGISGYRVSRWQAAAAPYRLELDPELAARLQLD